MISLYKPNLEDYWYEEKVLQDKETMSYNAGWDTSYEGYNYNTGCIDFQKIKWQEKYNKRKDSNYNFYYLKLDDKYIGFCNFQKNLKLNRWECGIVIEKKYRMLGYGKKGLYLLCQEAFKNNNIKCLYDSFENNRNATKIFYEIGFKRHKEFKSKRFDKEINMIGVCLNKEDFRR